MKYAKNDLHLVMIILSVIAVLINLGLCLMFLLTPMTMGLLILCPLSSCIIFILIFKLYLSIWIGKRNYLVIEDGIIIKDRGVLLPKFTAPLNGVKRSIVVGNQLRASLTDGRELRIYMDCVKIDDLCELKKLLQLD
jgi:hypothetical protein